MVAWHRPLVVLVAAVAGCSDVHPSVLAETAPARGAAAGPVVSIDGAATASPTTGGHGTGGGDEPGSSPAAVTTARTRTLSGTVVSAASGSPLAGASITAGDESVLTTSDGRFTIAAAPDDQLRVRRAAWEPVELEPTAIADTELVVELEARIVRGLRVSSYVAGDRAEFDELLALADRTTVNALVFDTKDESDRVLYETGVSFAHEIGAVEPVYDPRELLAAAREHDLYAITRIVTFEDDGWARSTPDAKLAGAWVDAANRDNWSYPIDLAVEACQLGFDEIQFDYVRFPTGQSAVIAADLVPATQEERSRAISDFLARARTELVAEGCAVSAAIFGIVMSSETDERLGQTPETISTVVDAVSPMLYPSHYSPGWLGFADPNDHPGPVVAHALDSASGRIDTDAVVRPWLQGFYYRGDQVLAQIREAEARGAGWIIWNAGGYYQADWLPPS